MTGDSEVSNTVANCLARVLSLLPAPSSSHCIRPSKLDKCKSKIGPHHVANAADISDLLWASSTILPIGKGETSFPRVAILPELAQWIPGKLVDGAFTGELQGRNSRLVKLHLPHRRFSCRSDSGLGILLLRASCISLLPRPEQETSFSPNTAV
ncbi:hypothetical protein N431DRAFT_239482 [Stipitochalara longipes BDJ]|nr:hypothetical protein N431DRAFT_239482 [Stipitochalara longipes BDJ]